MSPVITFLTDYGLEDGYVGACHGVIAGIAPDTRIIDLCHLVPAGDVRKGAAILVQTISCLPVGVHLCVVDPGAGSARRGVAVEAGGRVFVGPDNGLMSWALQACGGATSAYEITNADFFRRPISPTFHGRDVFSPVAAHLCLGRDPSELGPALDLDRLIILPEPTSLVSEGQVEGEVVSVDRFGNIQLSITAGDLAFLGMRAGLSVGVGIGRRSLSMPFRESFSAVPPGDLVIFTDAAGLIAIAVNSGDAAQQLALPPGARVRISNPH